MEFINSSLETVVVEQQLLQDVMNKHGLVLGGHWDYERVTYDFKFDIPEGIYYLRMPGYAVEGDVGANNATIQMMDPYLGKHYYPTGVEYGEDEVFPERIVKMCQDIIMKVVDDIKVVSPDSFKSTPHNA